MIREGAAAFLSGGGATNDASTAGGNEHKISCAEAGSSTHSFIRDCLFIEHPVHD